MAPWGSVQPRGAMPRGGSCSHSCSCTRPARGAVSYAVRSELSRRGASRRERDHRGVGPQDRGTPGSPLSLSFDCSHGEKPVPGVRTWGRAKRVRLDRFTPDSDSPLTT